MNHTSSCLIISQNPNSVNWIGGFYFEPDQSFNHVFDRFSEVHSPPLRFTSHTDGTCVHHPGYCQEWTFGEWVILAGHCVTGGNFQQIRYPAVISLCFLTTLFQQLPVLRYVTSGQDLILAFVATSSLILTWSVQVAMSFGKTRPDLTTTDTDVQ